MPRPLRPAALAFTLAALTGACSLTRGGAPEAADAPSGLTDANIAAIVVAANNADILYAEQALAKTQDPEVRSFATFVKADHQGVNKAATELVTRLGVTPVDNALSFDLRDDAEAKRLRFRELEGFAFDSAYAANEVTYHTTLLSAIDQALIPAAKNAELRSLLVQVRPAVEAHLAHAKQLSAVKAVRR